MLLRLKFVLLLVLVASCSSAPPITDYDPSVNFGQYKTFAFISAHPLMKGEGVTGTSPLLESRLMQVTENVVSSRGLRRVADPEDADIAIAFTLGSREKIQVNNYPEPYRRYYGGWGWGGAYYSGASQVDVRQYTEGVLAIDIYDVSMRKPVWHGTATKRITNKIRENPQQTINEIVPAILGAFPPN